MNKKQRVVSSLFLVMTFLLMGCVDIPDSIKTTGSIVDSLAEVQTTPSLYVGLPARFGGKVISVNNQQNFTCIEIAVLPLDAYARPLVGHPSMGRIIAKIDKFIDPIDLNNRLVTVVGKITGTQQGKIGHSSYNFVTVDITGYQRWHITQQVRQPFFYNDVYYMGVPYHWYSEIPWYSITPNLMKDLESPSK